MLKRLTAAMLATIMIAQLLMPPANASVSGFKLPQISETETDSAGAFIKQKNYHFDNGDFFWMRKFSFYGNSGAHYTSISIPGENGTVKYYDTDAAEWKTIPITGAMPFANLHIDTDKFHFIISPAYLYKPAENNSIEEQPLLQHKITIEKLDGCFRINFKFTIKKDYVGYVWGLQSREELVPWTLGATSSMWAGYSNPEQRWTYDGFFVKTPSTYIPYSKNMFWPSPAAYLPNSLTRTGQSRASDDLSYVMLDTLTDLQTDDGYWASAAVSRWLKKDYGIGSLYYDTRFNTDLVNTFFVGYAKWGDPKFLKTAEAGAQWYMDFAAEHHYTFTDENGSEGWLIEDYCWPGHEARRTLSALNHHASGMLMLLEGYKTTGNKNYLEIADKMFTGIKLTRNNWLREDGSLHYAILPDGSYGVQDYPSLTYNDLLNLQKARVSMGYPSDPDLQFLIDTKKAQMDRDGVTGYAK